MNETMQIIQQNGQWFNYPDFINYIQTQNPGQKKPMKARYFGQKVTSMNQDHYSGLEYADTSLSGNKVITRRDLIEQSRASRNPDAHKTQKDPVMDLPDCGKYSYHSKKSGGSKVIYSRTGAQKRHSTVSKSEVSNFTYGADSKSGVSQAASDIKSLLSKKNVDRFNENFEETGKQAILSSKQSKFSGAS